MSEYSSTLKPTLWIVKLKTKYTLLYINYIDIVYLFLH